MKLALQTDSVQHLSADEAFDLAAACGASGVELGTGGQSPAKHLDLQALLASPARRQALEDALASRGLELVALNCSAWPLHPVHGPAHERLVRDTLRLASELGVRTVVTMSGCPGDGQAATTITWVAYPWPADAIALLERQWELAIAFWEDVAAEAERRAIRLAFELHPLHLAYNVPTLLRLREACGPAVGANLDPSHLFWQAADPLAVARELGQAVHHVHLKDTASNAGELARAGVLDTRPFADPDRRAWTFCTVGRGHGVDFWRRFLAALRGIGYDGPLSIENEDPRQPAAEGVREASAFVRPLLAE